MTTPLAEPARPVIFGRSSSHFTRITRIFAAEMRVEHGFQVVRDLLSSDAADYGGHPALRVPTLQTARGVWFGSLNICRELARLSSEPPRTVWPEDLDGSLPGNAQELVAQAMATGVTLIMAKVTHNEDNAHQVKMRKSLSNMMTWLEDNAGPVLSALPAERELSYLEVSLFCLVTHLPFRGVLSIEPYRALAEFCGRFGERPSAQATPYRFDT